MKSRPLPNKIRFTQEGYDELKKRHDELTAERPDAVEHLRKSREMGDLKENGYYKASRSKLNFIDGQLTRMKFQLKNAQIVETGSSDRIDIGSTITLKNDEREMTFQIVGDLEANPSEGKLSMLSPIGRATKGRKVGDEIIIETPRGKIVYILKDIK